MPVYDFQAFAKRRDEQRSVEQIEELVPRLNEPGIVVEFKRRVETWLRQQELRKAS